VGRVVVLSNLLTVLVVFRRQHRDMPGLAVEIDSGTLYRALGLLVRREQGVLNGTGEDLEWQVFLSLHQSQHGDVDVHLIPPRPRCAPLWAD
jgi:hypothetical protein